MTKGIYKLTNKRTGKVYVGQTNNLERRKKEHMSDLASGTHHNQRMQQDYNRGDRFSFQVLEHVNGTRDDLNRRENFQIRKHNSFHNGYNQTRGGDYTQTGQKYLNQRKYGGQSNGYRRRYKGKQYTTGTYNPKKDETSLGKCFAGILIVFILFYLIANFINYLITYRPMQFLYGILIILTISVIVYIVYKARLYDKYRQHKNIYYCPTCKKHVKFVDGNCPTCYEKNKKNLEYAKKIQNERVSKKGNVKKNTASYIKCPNCKSSIWGKNPNRCPYCHYNFKTKLIDDGEKNTARYIKCPNCKSMIWGKNPNRCPYCHYNFKTKLIEDNESKDKPEYVHCKICNHLIDIDFGICEYCGFDINDECEDGKQPEDVEHIDSDECKKQPEDVEHICSADESEKQSESVQCPICNNLIDVDFDICEYCGFDIDKKDEPEEQLECVQCPICNNLINVKYGICDFCGFEIIDDTAKKSNDEMKKSYNYHNNAIEKVDYAKELQHKRLGPDSHYKRCPLCKKLVNKSSDSCKYCHHKF